MCHELAHVIDSVIGASGRFGSDSHGNASGMIQEMILSSCGSGHGSLANDVSINAASSPEEWFADSIAEALCSPSPRPVANATLEWAVAAMGAI